MLKLCAAETKTENKQVCVQLYTIAFCPGIGRPAQPPTTKLMRREAQAKASSLQNRSPSFDERNAPEHAFKDTIPQQAWPQTIQPSMPLNSNLSPMNPFLSQEQAPQLRSQFTFQQQPSQLQAQHSAQAVPAQGTPSISSKPTANLFTNMTMPTIPTNMPPLDGFDPLRALPTLPGAPIMTTENFDFNGG
jgi:hypothetical protein